ncbi:DUF6306 domain-containing protein [Sphingobium estronivorans]|uniref:DUF6306 domain-containing protein n=1 Tax=Sphingobium estronivorans TaxID=1577690 RepID=UPI0012398D70|nr:DUF6306 domain-containing protein [Sphingobium estronivorans]
MTDEPASPVCYAADGSDAYMGYAERDEILAALNELLEAEKAGARVALNSSKSTSPTGYAPLMQDVRKDEAHWCAMLTRHIQRIGGVPSSATGAFLGKAMAIADPLERLAFLNRGQAWVVKRIETITPRIRDESLHADLRDMAEKHRVNIGIADAFLEGHADR